MNARIASVQEYLEKWSIPEPNSGCWLWFGPSNSAGYGIVKISVSGPRATSAHRASYKLARGEIPRGLQIDHLCRNPSCINPEHMEAVTQRVNVLRGIGPTAVNARKTHCSRGHEFTPENTLPRKVGHWCRKCQSMASVHWAKRNHERMDKYKAEWRKLNRAHLAAYKAEYKRRNKGKQK